jgi:hypothetical protein
MGTYTFDTFRDSLKFELGQRVDLESPTNFYSSWINAAYLSLTTRDKLFGTNRSFWFPQLETSGTATTTAGSAYVLTPSDALVIRRIWNTTDDAYLKPITKDEYYKRLGKATTARRDTPAEYVRLGANIYLSPTPDDSDTSLTIYYRKVPAVLSDSTDVTVLGPEWDEPILKLAVIQAHQRLKEYDLAKLEKEAWVEDVIGLMGVYAQEERANETVIGMSSQSGSGY